LERGEIAAAGALMASQDELRDTRGQLKEANDCLARSKCEHSEAMEQLVDTREQLAEARKKLAEANKQVKEARRVLFLAREDLGSKL